MREFMRLSFISLTSFILFFVSISCAKHSITTSVYSGDEVSNQKIIEDYELGPEDVLEVLVWRNEALSKVVTVRPDGKVSLPLIGDIQASGQTVDQVREAITEKLKAYYNEPPQVSLIVKEVNSYVIYIMGEVQRPAQYIVKRGTTFLQAVALAGGFTPFASTNDIVVLRKPADDSSQLAFNIRYKDIMAGKYQENNILLRSGDTIIVP